MQYTGTAVLTTDRLVLRPYRSGDAPAMFRNWASDPEVTKFLTWPTHASVQTTEKVVSNWIARYADPQVFHWAITLKGNDEPIGDINVVRIDDAVSAAEIGYCLSRALWRRGIMPEALQAVMGYLFDCGFLRIAACHDVRNPASGRVMEKAGMKYEGCLRQSRRNNQGIEDVVWHAALREDYLKEKERKET